MCFRESLESIAVLGQLPVEFPKYGMSEIGGHFLDLGQDGESSASLAKVSESAKWGGGASGSTFSV